MRRWLALSISGLVALVAACGDGASPAVQAIEVTVHGAASGYVGLPVALQVDLPGAGDEAEPVHVAWDFDAADTGVDPGLDNADIDAVGLEVEAVWHVPGTYTVRATATAASGRVGHAEARVEIGADFVPPTVRVPRAVDAVVGEVVILDGSRSTDNVGIERWAWDADLGGGGAVDAAGPVLTHTYRRPGTYFASLTVWDGAGLHASGNVRVTVHADPDAAGGAGPDVVNLPGPADVALAAQARVPAGARGDLVAWPDAVYVVDEPVQIDGVGGRTRVRVEARYPDGGAQSLEVEAVHADGGIATADGDRLTGASIGVSTARAEVRLGPHVLAVPFDVVVRPVALVQGGGVWRVLPSGEVGAAVDAVRDTSRVPGRLFALVTVGDAAFVDAFDAFGRAVDRVPVPADTRAIVAESTTHVWTLGASGLGRISAGAWDAVAELDRAGEPVAAVWGDVELHVWLDGPDGAQRATWRVDDATWRDPGASRSVVGCDRVVDAVRLGDRVAVACNGAEGGRVEVSQVGAQLRPVAAWSAPGPIRALVLDGAHGHALVIADGARSQAVHRVGLTDGQWIMSKDVIARAVMSTSAGALLVGRPDGVWSIDGAAEEHVLDGTAEALLALPSAREPIVLTPETAWIATSDGDASAATEGLYGPPHGRGARAQNAEPGDLVSIPDGGRIVIELEGVELIDGPGADLVVFENPFEVGRRLTRWMEPGVVELGLGSSLRPVPTQVDASIAADVDGDPARYVAGFFGVVPVRANPDRNDLVPGHVAGGGDAFDLAAAGRAAADRVELVDVPGDGFSPDVDAVALVHWRRVVRPAAVLAGADR